MMKEFHISNRKRIAEKMKDNSMLILFAGSAPKKSADEAYKFTPNRNFLYMTGIDEENIILVMRKAEGKIMESLFIKERDAVMVKWVGETISSERAEEASGISDIRFLQTFENFMNLAIGKEDLYRVYLDLEKDSYDSLDTRGVSFAKEIVSRYPQVKVRNIYNEISALRVFKTPEEIEKIKKAIDITGKGIMNIMKNAKAGMKENQLEAHFDFTLKSEGVKDFAFTTICAAGHNATVLHYVENNHEVKENDMVLLDLGAQFEYYSGDISRTFPVSGKFTDRQRVFYDLVLKAHDEVIKMLKPGVPYARINELVQEIYAKELKALGLIEKDEEVRRYYYHNTSHYLGMDTHDVGRRDVILEEGMVLTVEPGLYIEEESIGIRLEDDILITKDGCENLSKDIIITADDVEKFLASR
ncbi:aminopeptidase P family protein [Proteiniclasticum sp.]|uniref:aminopeptidase P family protein n=1 Tax=Proteiniclasticum sp. TaxID=2053595 RepID=UPI00289B466A|nr:aminopeptidase P family protein [Proteiniclasticum sp.]